MRDLAIKTHNRFQYADKCKMEKILFKGYSPIMIPNGEAVSIYGIPFSGQLGLPGFWLALLAFSIALALYRKSAR